MFDAGFAELLLLFVIGLLILGPERLPRVAAQLGRWVGKARRTANQLRYQLEREVALDEIARNKKRTQRPGDAAPGTPPPDQAPDGASAEAEASGEETPAAAGDAADGSTSEAPSAPRSDAAAPETQPRPGPSARSAATAEHGADERHETEAAEPADHSTTAR